MTAKQDAVINELNTKVERLIKLYISSLDKNREMDSEMKELRIQIERMKSENMKLHEEIKTLKVAAAISTGEGSSEAKNRISQLVREITLNIAGRPCVLTIEREEEEEIRKAAQLINSKIAKYREKYATADPVDFLAVTALQFTVKMLEAERRNDVEPVLDEVKKINSRLDEVVKE